MRACSTGGTRSGQHAQHEEEGGLTACAMHAMHAWEGMHTERRSGGTGEIAAWFATHGDGVSSERVRNRNRVPRPMQHGGCGGADACVWNPHACLTTPTRLPTGVSSSSPWMRRLPPRYGAPSRLLKRKFITANFQHATCTNKRCTPLQGRVLYEEIAV